jgi:hypothetical protein
MEQINMSTWPFDNPPDGIVVTTKYVTQDRRPILYVTHERDEEEGIIWQFHCGNGDYAASVVQLARLDEILELDSGLYDIASLPLGFCAKRASLKGQWAIEKE